MEGPINSHDVKEIQVGRIFYLKIIRLREFRVNMGKTIVQTFLGWTWLKPPEI